MARDDERLATQRSRAQLPGPQRAMARRDWCQTATLAPALPARSRKHEHTHTWDACACINVAFAEAYSPAAWRQPKDTRPLNRHTRESVSWLGAPPDPPATEHFSCPSIAFPLGDARQTPLSQPRSSPCGPLYPATRRFAQLGAPLLPSPAWRWAPRSSVLAPTRPTVFLLHRPKPTMASRKAGSSLTSLPHEVETTKEADEAAADHVTHKPEAGKTSNATAADETTQAPADDAPVACLPLRDLASRFRDSCLPSSDVAASLVRSLPNPKRM